MEHLLFQSEFCSIFRVRNVPSRRAQEAPSLVVRGRLEYRTILASFFVATQSVCRALTVQGNSFVQDCNRPHPLADDVSFVMADGICNTVKSRTNLSLMAETSTSFRIDQTVCFRQRFLLTSSQNLKNQSFLQHLYRNFEFHRSGTREERKMARSTRIGKIRPSFLLQVMLVTISLGLAIFIKPHASLLLLQSFPNSSLWRERHLSSRRQGQQQNQQGQQQDYYHILGVRRNANKDDIKTAFRQLVKQYHPGRC